MLLVQSQGPLAVFFYIGGFLVSFLIIKEVVGDNWRLLINILQRALRILPSFLFVILLYLAYYPLLSPNQDWNGNNPPLGSDSDCYHIWKVIFFIDNFVPLGGLCYSVGWYLHVDMQLFVISMLILKLYKNKPKTCKILIWILIVVSIIQLFVYSQLTGYANGVLMKDKTRVGPSWGY
jgi:peptidoglycan/LPS O-acetylase OafA/YrhL